MKRLFKLTYIVLSVCLLTFAISFYNITNVRAAEYTLPTVANSNYKSGDVLTNGTGSTKYLEFYVNDTKVKSNVNVFNNATYRVPYINGSSVQWNLKEIGNGAGSTGNVYRFYATFNDFNLYLGCNNDSIKSDGKAKCGISYTFGQKIDTTSVNNLELEIKYIKFNLDSKVVSLENYKSDFEFQYIKQTKTFIYDSSKQSITTKPAAAFTLDTLPGVMLGTFEVSYDGNSTGTSSGISLSNIGFTYQTQEGTSIYTSVNNIDKDITVSDKEVIKGSESDSDKTTEKVTDNPNTGVFNYLLLLIPVGILAVGFVLINTRKTTFKNN